MIWFVIFLIATTVFTAGAIWGYLFGEKDGYEAAYREVNYYYQQKNRY